MYLPTGTNCNCKPMPNIPHTIVKNGAHMLAKGLANMKGSGNLPLLGKHSALEQNIGCPREGNSIIKGF